MFSTSAHVVRQVEMLLLDGMRLLGHVVEVGPVALRQYVLGQAGTMRREHFASTPPIAAHALVV